MPLNGTTYRNVFAVYRAMLDARSLAELLVITVNSGNFYLYFCHHDPYNNYRPKVSESPRPCIRLHSRLRPKNFFGCDTSPVV